MNKKQQKYIKDKFSNICFIDEPMSKHTTFGIGGNAKVLMLPENLIEIKNILHYSNQYDINVVFVGSGSNLLISGAKSLAISYKGKTDIEINTLNSAIHSIKKTIEESANLYETMLDRTTKSLEQIIEKTESKSQIQ